MNKRNFYKWHRILGLTALVPVIFWALSGLSHPFMSNWFRPQIAKESFVPLSQSEMKPVLSIQQVMDQNHITKLRNFGLINFDKGTYYQVLGIDSTYNYYSATDGSLLTDGDKNYAIYLARYFTQDSTSKVKSLTLQTQFDINYQPINRLLPVWKVAFDRPDGMDVYVETSHSRMGTFNNNTRKTFLWIFEQFHTWDLLVQLGGEQFRLIVLMILVSAMFLTLVSGLIVYGLYWKSFKAVQQKRKQNGVDDKRFIHRYHRQVGLIVSLIMLFFIFSGGFHIFIQLYNIGTKIQPYQQTISRADLNFSNLQLPVADSSIKKISLASFDGNPFYQVTNNKKEVLYYDTNVGLELQGGDQEYATFLARYYSSDYNSIDSISRINQFTNDYGFINKRLPVQQVIDGEGESLYIETTSAKLATQITSLDRAEGLSFIFLHKFFWMTWAGKDIRDIVSMIAALGVLVVALLGFVSFIKNK